MLMQKIIIWIIACLLSVCCLYTHRRVIKAWLRGATAESTEMALLGKA